MDFLNEKEQKELNLTPEQITGLTLFYTSHLAELQKGWDDKANKNAEGILGGAAEAVEKITGIKRAEGQKIADYFVHSGTEFVKGKQAELDKLKTDYEEKIKGVKGSEALTAEYEKMKAEKDDILKKYADYDTLKEKADKYDPMTEEYRAMKLEVSFSSIKPTFPESVNPYEAKAKWDEFKANVLKEWDIEYKDGEAVAINKENPYKIEKLKDLASKDEQITALAAGRQQKGSGTETKELEKIEGVPFDVPKGATSAERATLIKDYLAKSGIGSLSPQYAAKFAEINNKILQKTAS